MPYYRSVVYIFLPESPDYVQRPVALTEDWIEYAPGKMFNVTGWGTLSDSYVR